MLTYHPAFDIYHTAFRILKILECNEYRSIEKIKLRIFDFLILFPHELKNVQVPAGAKGIKSLYKENKYNHLPDRRRVFYQIGKYFEASIQCLVSYEIIDSESYKMDIIAIKNKEFIHKIGALNNTSLSIEYITSLKNVFMEMNTTELKKRTGLIEYRYDLFEVK